MEFLKEEFNMGLQIFELFLDTQKSVTIKSKQTNKCKYTTTCLKNKKEKSLFSVTVPKYRLSNDKNAEIFQLIPLVWSLSEFLSLF